MSIRLITTVGGAYSNSYVTLLEADTFAVNFPWYNTTTDQTGNELKGWSQFTEAEQTTALIQAAFSLQGLPWNGQRCGVASDAGMPVLDWDKYLITGSVSSQGVFGYFDDGGSYRGSGQGDNVFRWGTEGAPLFTNLTSFRRKAFETGFKFFDKEDNELPPTGYQIISSSGSSGDSTDDVRYYWDTAIDLAYIRGTYNDSFRPGSSGTWYWGCYVNDEQLFNFPGTTPTQAQRLAWPRIDITCEGEVADCSFIPQTIKNAQVLIAYNFLIRPYLVPGTPSIPPTAPAGTFVSEQTLGSLSVKYTQYQGFDPADSDCNDCSDPYLYKVFDWLSAMLGCWVTSSGGYGLRLRVRS